MHPPICDVDQHHYDHPHDDPQQHQQPEHTDQMMMHFLTNAYSTSQKHLPPTTTPTIDPSSQCIPAKIGRRRLRFRLVPWPRFKCPHVWRLVVLLCVGCHLIVRSNAVSIVSANAVDKPMTNGTAIDLTQPLPKGSAIPTSTTTNTTLSPRPSTTIASPTPTDNVTANQQSRDKVMMTKAAPAAATLRIDIGNQVVGAVQLKSVQQANQQQKQPGADNKDEDEYYFDIDDDLDEYQLLISNKSAKGMYIGAPCEQTCNAKLHHVICEPTNNVCGCEKNYPVPIGRTKGCAKSKKLGEQCFYHESCLHSDPNALCLQVKHNALCQCADGFHSVSYSKPTKRIFCTQDMAVLTSDLPTLLGVSSGIAVLAGLICMVLHLFSKTKYPRHRNYADANIPPPIMYSTDTEIPLTVHSGRPSSRSSIRSSNSINSYTNRRPSSAPHSGSKGVLVSTSRSGSRRPSLASVHSTTSSVKSYSMQRIEKELQQKELRQEMKLRLARLQHHTVNKPQIIIIGGGGGVVGGGLHNGSGSGGVFSSRSEHGAIGGNASGYTFMGGDPLMHYQGGMMKCGAMPSPLTPNSTDELLPSVDEAQEFSPPLSIHASDATYIGPCSSSEALLD